MINPFVEIGQQADPDHIFLGLIQTPHSGHLYYKVKLLHSSGQIIVLDPSNLKGNLLNVHYSTTSLCSLAVYNDWFYLYDLVNGVRFCTKSICVQDISRFKIKHGAYDFSLSCGKFLAAKQPIEII